jgi:hypothetical protein
MVFKIFFTIESLNGLVNGFDKVVQSLSPESDEGSMIAERLFHVEIGRIEDFSDFIQAKIQFTEEHDLLQLQNVIPRIPAVIVGRRSLGLQKPDIVIMLKRTAVRAGELCELLDGVMALLSRIFDIFIMHIDWSIGPDDSINYHVT